MKKTLTFALLFVLLHSYAPVFAGETWHLLSARPGINTEGQKPAARYLSYTVDEQALSLSLSAKSTSGRTIELPMPDGNFRNFRVVESSLLPAALAAKYPEIKTYTAYAVDDENVTAKLDVTVYGFHAMVYDGNNTSFINPADISQSGKYNVYYKKDEIRNSSTACGTISNGRTDQIGRDALLLRLTDGPKMRTVNGYSLRRYRLALSCSHQYAQAATGSASPTVAQVLSKMTTTMNRVNGIYEREVSVTMTFADNEDTLIFPVAAGDPFGANNFDVSSLLSLNQIMCDSLIGNANYDVGHIFSTSPEGGLSQLGNICQAGSKAQSVTGREDPTGDGFDIDYVAHEMGHEFGADHTFNNSQLGGCTGNAVAGHAFEPGSGSTIMAYAGLCSPDNLQAHSDAYFHATSLQQIQDYLITGGNTCGDKIPTGNKQPGIAPFTASYSIPAKTPFELTAPTAVDSTGDKMIYYCWEQWNLGDFGKKLVNTAKYGPMFRSYPPTLSPVRTFPNMNMVRTGTLSNAGIDNKSGEKIPDSARYLTFKLAGRSIHNGLGCFVLPDDTIHLDVINTESGFTVTSQNTNGITYEGFSKHTVNWNVAGTTAAPINATTVDIYMSADSGYTWPYHLGNFPNNGSASVTIPNPDSTIKAARIKVKGGNNVFFNINTRDFRVLRNLETSILAYPIPAHDILHVTTNKTGTLQIAMFDMMGRLAWRDEINTTSFDIPVYLLARGVYTMKLVDNMGRKVIERIVLD